MKFFDFVKNLFSSSKEKETNPTPKTKEKDSRDISNKQAKGKIREKEEKEISNEGNQDEMLEIAEKAYNARSEGDFKKALRLWEQFGNQYPKNKYQAMARKARIYIVMDKKKEAKEELLNFFEWYSQKESFNYNSKYFTVIISALQDLGYLVDTWADEEKYLANLSGEDISLQKEMTVDRIRTALSYLQQEEVWSSALKKIEKNLDMLY